MTNYKQQLNKILNPKGCGKNFSSGNAPYICGKDKWIDGYSLCPICKERVKAYHRMANLWLDDANSKQIVYWDENHQDWEWDYDKKLIKELSTFIQEIEKIAKENHIELPMSSNKDICETKLVAEECGFLNQEKSSLDGLSIVSSDNKCNSPPLAPIQEIEKIAKQENIELK